MQEHWAPDSIIGELARKAEFQTLTQIYGIKICVLKDPQVTCVNIKFEGHYFSS